MRFAGGDQLLSEGFGGQLQQVCAVSQQPYPGQVDPLQLDDLLPDGVPDPQQQAGRMKDEEHQWSYGDLAMQDTDYQQRLRDILVERKHAFAYSLKELPGYNGPPVHFEMVDPDKPIQARQRQFSKLESDIRDEKCTELHDVGFITEVPTTNKWSSNPTIAAKKDAHGQRCVSRDIPSC